MTVRSLLTLVIVLIDRDRCSGVSTVVMHLRDPGRCRSRIGCNDDWAAFDAQGDTAVGVRQSLGVPPSGRRQAFAAAVVLVLR